MDKIMASPSRRLAACEEDYGDVCLPGRVERQLQFSCNSKKELELFNAKEAEGTFMQFHEAEMDQSKDETVVAAVDDLLGLVVDTELWLTEDLCESAKVQRDAKCEGCATPTAVLSLPSSPDRSPPSSADCSPPSSSPSSPRTELDHQAALEAAALILRTHSITTREDGHQQHSARRPPTHRARNAEHATSAQHCSPQQPDCWQEDQGGPVNSAQEPSPPLQRSTPAAQYPPPELDTKDYSSCYQPEAVYYPHSTQQYGWCDGYAAQSCGQSSAAHDLCPVVAIPAEQAQEMPWTPEEQQWTPQEQRWSPQEQRRSPKEQQWTAPEQQALIAAYVSNAARLMRPPRPVQICAPEPDKPAQVPQLKALEQASRSTAPADMCLSAPSETQLQPAAAHDQAPEAAASSGDKGISWEDLVELHLPRMDTGISWADIVDEEYGDDAVSSFGTSSTTDTNMDNDGHLLEQAGTIERIVDSDSLAQLASSLTQASAASVLPSKAAALPNCTSSSDQGGAQQYSIPASADTPCMPEYVASFIPEQLEAPSPDVLTAASPPVHLRAAAGSVTKEQAGISAEQPQPARASIRCTRERKGLLEMAADVFNSSYYCVYVHGRQW